MATEKMVEDIVREVLKSMYQGKDTSGNQTSQSAAGKGQGLNADKDYPLSTKRPELLKTPTGKKLSDITIEKVLNGEVTAKDVSIAPETLRMQAEIADSVNRKQFGDNLRRAAELTIVPDKRILEIYNALRPNRSTKQELLAIADELEQQYHAKINADLIREAADVYERRNRLRVQ